MCRLERKKYIIDVQSKGTELIYFNAALKVQRSSLFLDKYNNAVLIKRRWSV